MSFRTLIFLIQFSILFIWLMGGTGRNKGRNSQSYDMYLLLYCFCPLKIYKWLMLAFNHGVPHQSITVWIQDYSLMMLCLFYIPYIRKDLCGPNSQMTILGQWSPINNLRKNRRVSLWLFFELTKKENSLWEPGGT